MRLKNLGEYKNINAYVDGKLAKFDKTERDFSALFDTMFSERENIMYEKSEGYRIVKTTYGQARESVLRLTSTLSDLFSDIPQNSVIGLYMDNSLLWIELFWAILHAGFRPLLLNLRVDDTRLEYALKASEAKAVISDKKTFSVKTVLACDIKENEKATDNAVFGSSVLIMSSGTSAHVKLCSYTSNEFYLLIRNSYDIIKKCKVAKKHYNGELKQLTFLPFYHIFGLVAMYIWFAFFARTFVQLNDMAPDTIVNTVKRHGVTHIFAVPLFWETVYKTAIKTINSRGEQTVKKFNKGMKIADRLSFCPPLYRAFTKTAFKEVRENIFGDSISFMITGGSRIGCDVLRFFNNIGYRLVNGYGMSEIAITSVELSSDPRLICSGSVGKPLEGIKYSISDDGTLLVSSKSMAEYVIVEGEKIPRPDVFDTRDLAEEYKGRYKILGRADDLIIGSDGENINPLIVEEQTEKINGVRGVCLVGVSDGEADIPTLIVSVAKYTDKTSLISLEAAINDALERTNMRARVKKTVFTTDNLIQGDEFKLNRRRILSDYQTGKMALITEETAEVPGELDAIETFVRDCFATVLGKEAGKISVKADLFTDEGGSSLDYFAIISALQREFGVPFPTDAGSGLSTVTSLSDYVKEQMKNADKTV